MTTTASNDAVKVARDVYTVLFENERVGVVDVRMAPGQSPAKHSHPDGVWYALAPMKARFTSAGGGAADAEIPRVQSGARPRRTRSTTSGRRIFGPSLSNSNSNDRARARAVLGAGTNTPAPVPINHSRSQYLERLGVAPSVPCESARARASAQKGQRDGNGDRPLPPH